MSVVCRVDRQATGRYALVIIPQGGAAATLGRMAIYTSALEAVRQHAAVAAALRGLGWTLIEHTGTGSPDRGVANAVAA